MRLHADDLDLEEPKAAMAMAKSANGNRWKSPMTGDFHGKNMEEEGKSSINLVDSPFNEIASSNQRQYLWAGKIIYNLVGFSGAIVWLPEAMPWKIHDGLIKWLIQLKHKNKQRTFQDEYYKPVGREQLKSSEARLFGDIFTADFLPMWSAKWYIQNHSSQVQSVPSMTPWDAGTLGRTKQETLTAHPNREVAARAVRKGQSWLAH